MAKTNTAFLKQAALAELGHFESMARRRFGDEALAGEAVNHVLDALAADDWRRVRGHRGDARLASYLRTVAARLLEDFARARFGRVRVPDWVRVRGALWERVYRLLCLERQSSRATAELVAADAPGGRDRAVVEEALRLILARYPNCGAHGPEEVLLEDATGAEAPGGGDPLASGGGPEDDCLASEQAVLMRAVRGRLLGLQVDGGGADAAASRTRAASAADSGAPAGLPDLPPLTLSAEERLLLRLVYLDGLRVTAAGKLLGLGAHQTHGRLRRLHGRLRAWLEAAGVRLEPEDFT